MRAWRAVFPTDLIALGILQALTLGSDIRVPEDIAVIGYDDIDFVVTALKEAGLIRAV